VVSPYPPRCFKEHCRQCWCSTEWADAAPTSRLRLPKGQCRICALRDLPLPRHFASVRHARTELIAKPHPTPKLCMQDGRGCTEAPAVALQEKRPMSGLFARLSFPGSTPLSALFACATNSKTANRSLLQATGRARKHCGSPHDCTIPDCLQSATWLQHVGGCTTNLRPSVQTAACCGCRRLSAGGERHEQGEEQGQRPATRLR
jgi:hypothetical protein